MASVYEIICKVLQPGQRRVSLRRTWSFHPHRASLILGNRRMIRVIPENFERGCLGRLPFDATPRAIDDLQMGNAATRTDQLLIWSPPPSDCLMEVRLAFRSV